MKEIYELETIDELKDYINTVSTDTLRPLLLTEFDRLVKYKNIKEWNELVRVCEALSIVGWGDNEPFEATADKWINGAFYTELRNKSFEQKLEWSKQWSKQKDSFVIYDTDSDKTDYKIAKFASQRNKLPKCPIRWIRSGNYQSSLQPLIDSLEILKERVIRKTRPELYGDTFSYIGINLYFGSQEYEHFHDEDDVPNDLKEAKTLNGMPVYYIRPRLEIGKLSTKDNDLRIIARRHFTKAFEYLHLSEQKKIIQDDFLEILNILSDKLKKKKIKYDTELLKQDTIKIFSEW